MFNQYLIFNLFLRNFLSRENIIFKLWNPLVYDLTKMLWKTFVPNFLSKLMCYVIVLAIKYQCTSESKPYFFLLLFSSYYCRYNNCNVHFNHDIYIKWKVKLVLVKMAIACKKC